MLLPSFVKPYPPFWKYIPVLNNFSGSAIYPFIFLQESIYKDLLQERPHVQNIAALRHEEKHREREMKIGWFLFALKYFFSAKFRLDEELLAYRVTMCELKKNQCLFNNERVAKLLSGPMYLWVCSYKDAKEKLTTIWDSCPNSHATQ